MFTSFVIAAFSSDFFVLRCKRRAKPYLNARMLVAKRQSRRRIHLAPGSMKIEELRTRREHGSVTEPAIRIGVLQRRSHLEDNRGARCRIQGSNSSGWFG